MNLVGYIKNGEHHVCTYILPKRLVITLSLQLGEHLREHMAKVVLKALDKPYDNLKWIVSQ